jgi:hypothetical protein
MEQKTDREKIADIYNEFPFEKVLAYMVLTGWKWRDKTPDLEEIKTTAYSCLDRALTEGKPEESYSGGTGGFYAYRFKWSGKLFFKLAFEPWHKSSY